MKSNQIKALIHILFHINAPTVQYVLFMYQNIEQSQTEASRSRDIFNYSVKLFELSNSELARLFYAMSYVNLKWFFWLFLPIYIFLIKTKLLLVSVNKIIKNYAFVFDSMLSTILHFSNIGQTIILFKWSYGCKYFQVCQTKES